MIPAVVSSTDPAPGALSPGLLGHYSAVSVSYPAVTQTSTHIEKKKKTYIFWTGFFLLFTAYTPPLPVMAAVTFEPTVRFLSLQTKKKTNPQLIKLAVKVRGFFLFCISRHTPNVSRPVKPCKKNSKCSDFNSARSEPGQNKSTLCEESRGSAASRSKTNQRVVNFPRAADTSTSPPSARVCVCVCAAASANQVRCKTPSSLCRCLWLV